MWFNNIIIKYFWFVILNFNSWLAYLNFILYNISINIKSCNYACAFAESYFVSLYLWYRCNSLSKNTCCITAHNNIFWNNNIIFRFTINHNCTWIKMRKWTFMNHHISFYWKNTSCKRLIYCISFKITMKNFYTRIRNGNYARYFSMSLFTASI